MCLVVHVCGCVMHRERECCVYFFVRICIVCIVCACVCMRACVHACVGTCVCVCVCVCVCACVCVHMHVAVHACVLMQYHVQCMYLRSSLNTYATTCFLLLLLQKGSH